MRRTLAAIAAMRRPELRKSLGVPDRSPAERASALQRSNLVVDVYCPWLSHFQTAD